MSDGTLLERSYVREAASGNGLLTRPAYLADAIFGLVTYDRGMDTRFGRKAVEVCMAITDRTTFAYIADPDNYQWFLLLCNLPFFATKIEWGISIRGAFWREKITLQSYGLWGPDGQQLAAPLTFDVPSWQTFVVGMRAFIEEPPHGLYLV